MEYDLIIRLIVNSNIAVVRYFNEKIEEEKKIEESLEELSQFLYSEEERKLYNILKEKIDELKIIEDEIEIIVFYENNKLKFKVNGENLEYEETYQKVR